MAAQDDAAHLHADGSEGQTASRFGFLDADENLPQYHIEAQASLVDRPLRALKYGEAFAVLDSYGDIGWVPGPEGLYFQDTRYLSRLALTIEDERPMMLSSAIQDDNGALSVDLTTPDIRLDAGDETAIPRELIAIERTKFLFKGACYDRIGLRNYDTRRRRLRIGVTFDADYRDLFEVRGSDRANRGKRTVERRSATEVQFRYAGLDEMVRTTSLHFGPKPHTLEPGKAEFVVELEPGANTSLFIRVVCQSHRAYTSAPGPERAGESAAAALSRAAGSLAEQPDRSLGEGRVFARAYRDNRRDQRQITAGITTIISSNDQFNEGLCRATADLYMLATRTQEGIYPFAGIPWYSTVFGRDGIITAMMALWIDPNFGKGVLRFLAATQAKEVDPAADAQPGKVLHETRRGEMAMLGEVPFRHYYGTIDGTPLFVMLAAQYHEVTGDLDTIRAIWPQLKLALEWIDTYGDRDGDGFVEYARETEQGLANQGWKDSHDSIFHADGAMAKGPIALCEVQGYVYAAKRGAARLASMLGEDDLSVRLSAAANTLRENFRQGVLVRGDRHLRARARWREAPMRRALLQHRPRPVHRHRPAEAGRGRRGAALVQRRVQRLGHPHHRQGRGALQSDVLPQRLDLAARQRDLRPRSRPLRPQGGGGAGVRGDVRHEPVLRPEAAAGAVLRLHAAAPARARELSRGLLAAGLGSGGALRLPGRLSRARNRPSPQPHPLPQSDPAALPRRGGAVQPQARRLAGGYPPASPRQRRDGVGDAARRRRADRDAEISLFTRCRRPHPSGAVGILKPRPVAPPRGALILRRKTKNAPPPRGSSAFADEPVPRDRGEAGAEAVSAAPGS
ncbi:glycogen debranching enzyme [Methylorubrum extorquens]|nr:glycogen debranching enzyme [Methylorubrum extorquens]